MSLSPTDHTIKRLRQLPGKCCTSFRKKSYQRKTALLLTKRCIQEWSSCQAVVQWVILPEGNQGEWDLSFHPKPPCLDKTIYIVYQKWLVILSNNLPRNLAFRDLNLASRTFLQLSLLQWLNPTRNKEQDSVYQESTSQLTTEHECGIELTSNLRPV